MLERILSKLFPHELNRRRGVPRPSRVNGAFCEHFHRWTLLHLAVELA